MALALYGEHGFYIDRRARRARGGDFLTSPEVGPLFGAVLGPGDRRRGGTARRARRLHRRRRRRRPGHAGPRVLAAEPACAALRYVAVEVVRRRSGPTHPDGVELAWPICPPGPLDRRRRRQRAARQPAVPARRVRRRVARGVRRRRRRTGGFAEVLSAPLDPVPAVLPRRAALGARAPLQRRGRGVGGRRRRAARARARWSPSTTPSRAPPRPPRRPWREWLRTLPRPRAGRALPRRSRAARTSPPRWASTSCRRPTRCVRRPSSSALHGIDELVAEGRRAWTGGAAAPDLAALRMRSRVAEAEALTDPHGLGAFDVLEWWSAGMSLPVR